jgi:hypothetical protein
MDSEPPVVDSVNPVHLMVQHGRLVVSRQLSASESAKLEGGNSIGEAQVIVVDLMMG